MNELFIKITQLKTDIDGNISNIYDNAKKHMKFDNLSTINSEVSTLNQKAEEIKQRINKMNSDITSLRHLVNNSTTIENTTVWRRKIANLESEALNLSSSLQRAYNFRMEKIRTEKEHFELFHGAQKKTMDSENEAIKIQIDTRDSLQRSAHRSSEAVELGNTVLGSLARQDDMMKGVQRKMYSMLNELGVSNNFIRMIQKRSRHDFYICMGLGVLLIIFMIVLIFVVKPYVRGK